VELQTPTQSERLRRRIELVLPALVVAGRRLVAHPSVRALYPEYLVTSHWIIRASVPLMEAARARAEALSETDATAAALARYLDEHIPEEIGHDEWLLDDLETLGIDRASVLARPPSTTVAAVVGAQYYYVLHHHPVALLGYIALLEGYPPSAELVDELAARTGYDAGAFRTLRIHAELDPGHRAELDATLDRLPLTREQATVISLSALYSVDGLARSLDEVIEESEHAAA
jgi:pyrroloquinoline quinone (PQQ) biosynthesis protein C